ncbi:TPA: type II toxin-antitoxin system HicA family toxin [Candidatus Poribacteria bacterium]|nr:type II toxin-antitoxin system HicA family toxin [Candidatus Poribacteria bacterium]HEX28472.1 type II toxin-antitoxin system HicA family toxin [Candidatus Poribacteria bacterium]
MYSRRNKLTTKLRELSYEEVTRRLRALGFRFYRQGKGSHELWVRDSDGRVVPVPRYKGKRIRKGTIRAIIREVGLSVEEFMSLNS